MPSHKCHVTSCHVLVPPRLLMCRIHWYMVPKALRRAVWATYVAGQEVTKTPSAEYLKAARAAINAVEEQL